MSKTTACKMYFSNIASHLQQCISDVTPEYYSMFNGLLPIKASFSVALCGMAFPNIMS